MSQKFKDAFDTVVGIGFGLTLLSVFGLCIVMSIDTVNRAVARAKMERERQKTENET